MKRLANSLRQFRQAVKRIFDRPNRAQNKRGYLPSVEAMEARELLAASFLAAAMPSGAVNVQLDPLANVTPGTQETVTFGVPFTRGSITQAQLANIRVLKNGVEIPAFVEQLTPWRNIDDPAIDGKSVRVARIQIGYTFASLNPESITVQWGGPARTLNVSTLQDPRLNWHTVTSGSFVAADGVQEPDVLPVLPAAYLSLGMLDSQTIPDNSSVAETRDNPAVMDAMTFTGFNEFDNAEKNFFYTIVNQNGTTPIDYKTQAEPWLYDRSAGMYQLYFRSGFATALREAIRSTDFYVSHLGSDGFFTLKPGDPKYSYNEAIAYTYWLLGDNRMLAPISTVVSAFNGTQTHWTPTLSFFTERNAGDKLLANDIGYEVTGNATFKSNVQTIVADFIFLQNGAGGQLPADRIDGGLYHFGFQHDITEVSSGDVLIASSWMSALIVDPMVRVFGVWGDNAQIPDFIVRMGNFEKAASLTDGDGQFGGITRYPDYLMRPDGTPDSRSDTDVQHAMDVGMVAAWATYFAELRGTPDASLRQLANDLYHTYDVGVNVWTSTSGGYQVTPPRRYNWEYKNSASFSWALTATDATGQAGVFRFGSPTFTVVENQPVATITVTRTGGSSGTVSVDYATSNGTATAGSDYTATSGTLTFADGETSKTFTVPILNDSAVENTETVVLMLSNPTGGASLDSPSTATLSIADDDTTSQPITATYQQGVNGYTGTTDVDISNQYVDNGATGINGDQLGVYQTTGSGAYTIHGFVRFDNLGIASTPATKVTVTGATLTLTVETFDANLVIRGYYLLAPWTIAPGTDLGWIHTGTGHDWAVPGGTGQGSDVVAGKSFLVPSITGNGTQTITINLDPAIVQSWLDNPSADQGIVLVNETTGAIVRVDASENANAGLRPKLSLSYTVSSTSSSQPGSLQFSNPTYSVNENQGTATVTVTRTGGSTGSVSVNYATSNGTATAGSDYTATSGTLTFADGETSKTFTIPISNDTAVEPDETVLLTLTSPTGGATLGTQTTASLTIVSDDVAPSGVLQFSASSFSVNENQGTATITVTRTGGSAGSVSVNYATSNGTATAGSDYTATSGTLTFADGEMSKTFTIPITNDTAVEPDETVLLTLTSPTGGATLGGQASATLTIVSDDAAPPGVLQFSASSFTVNENQGTATITVTRSGGSAGSVTVNYATSNGTATAGSDYTATSGTLTFADGEMSKTFTIPITNDSAVEADETVLLTLTSPTGGATLGGQASATLTIVSDDVAQPGVLQFSVSAYSVNENQGTATITVTRTGGSNVPVSVNFATSDGTATAGSDYTATSGTLSFGVGETSKTFTIPIINDTLVENPETVTLTLSSPTGGATLASPSTATLTIISDDTTGQPVTATFQQGVNGYTGTTDINISTQYAQYTSGNGTTTLNGKQMGVYQTTGSGSYITESLIRFSSLGIPAGATVSGATITLSVDSWVAGPTIRGYYLIPAWNGASGSTIGWLHRGTGQDWATPGELGQGTDVVAGKSFTISGIRAVGVQTITINLDPAIVQSWVNNPSTDQGILLVNQTPGAVVQINASEDSASVRPKLSVTYNSGTPQPGSLQFSNASYSVNENGGTATITVTRTGGSAGSVSVNYATSNGTATAGSDYIATSGTLTFADGETSKTFTIPITDDSVVEPNETVSLTLSSPTGGATLGTQTTATLTILNDDVAPQPGTLQFSNATYSVNENGGTVTITVTRTGGSAGSVSVNYATSNGTATAGSDYTATSGTLTFADGETSKTFTIPITDDSVVEPNETVNLTLSSPTGGATLGTQATAALTIVNDDVVTLQSITVAPTNPSLANRQTAQFTVTGHFSDGSSQVLTTGVTWSSSNTSIATISSSGLASAVGVGSATITATDGSLSTGTTLTVTAATNSPTVGAHTLAFVPFNSPAGSISTNPTTTQAAGSTVLAWVGRGQIGDFTAANAPTDNKGNHATQIDVTHSFAPLFPNSGMALYTFPSFAGGSNDIFNALMPNNDEVTLSIVEIKNGGVIQDSKWVQVPAAATQTSLSVTTTGPATLISFWTGDSASGAISAIPGNGFTLLDSQLQSNNAVQMAVASKDVSAAGTYNVTWSATPQQTGYIWIVAVQHGTPPPQPGTLQLSSSAFTVNEGGGSANITVTRTGGSDGAVSVNYATSNGSATAGSDYTATSGTLNFAAGETSKTFTIPITNDTAVEGNETVNLALSSPTGGATLGTASATLTIVDNDSPPPVGSFSNVTDSSGVAAIIAQKYQEDPNWWLSGEHLVDLDNDGVLDLFLDAHNGTSVAALNDGHGHFTRVTGSFPSTEIHEMYDINGDGKVDLNATFSDGGSQWWINNSTPGHVNFTATTITRDGNSSRSQVLMDFNGDGKVDWLRSAPPGLVVDLGDGNGHFTEGSFTFPIAGTDSNDNASFLPADFDGDGKTDLLVLVGGNYDGTPGKTLYWHNNGNMTFSDVTATSGIPANGTIAKGIGDFNHDGKIDFIAIENMSMPPVIYLNDGQGHFIKKANAISGIPAGSLDYTSWGTAVVTDVDNDGIADIVMDGKYYLKVLRGTGGGNFTYMNDAWHIKDTAAASVDDGLCFGDIDGDGRIDMIGYDETFPSRTLIVYHNDLTPQNYLNVRTVGQAGNVGAAGAIINIYAAGTNQLLWTESIAQYDFQVATSYYGYDETERHFGLAGVGSVDVAVTFASGKVTRVNGVSANQTIQVLE